MSVPFLRSIGLATTVSALALSIGCSGPQHTDDTDGCPSYNSGMSDSALSNAVVCHAATPTPAGVEVCRAALGRANELSEEALAASAPCLLPAGERADGAIIAEAFLSVHATPSKVVTLANALLPGFDRDTHANTFAVALSRDAQTGLGEALDAMEAAPRELIVSIALAFNLEPLSGFCAPYVRTISAEDPVMQNYAAGINQAQSLNETERWALAATGEWDGNDVFNCLNEEIAGCRDVDGGSPLELLAVVTDAGGPMPPSMALDQLRNGDITPEEAGAITVFLSENSYPNRSNYMNTVLGIMTNVERPLAIRRAIASHATERMCSWEVARAFIRNAETSDPNRDDPGSAWVQFVDHCNTAYWTAEDIAGALSVGSWLQVSHALVSELEARLATLTEGWTCDQYLSLADVAYAHRDVVFMAGQGVVTVANTAGETCAPQFMDRIEAISNDPEAHPEGRLPAIAWLLDHGDSSGCGNISAAMRWFHPDLHVGATPWAEEMQAELEPRCH